MSLMGAMEYQKLEITGQGKIKMIRVAQGATVYAGSVLGKIDGEDEYTIVDSKNENGPSNPECILVDFCVTTFFGSKVASAYVNGTLNKKMLKVGGSDTIEMYEACLIEAGFKLE